MEKKRYKNPEVCKKLFEENTIRLLEGKGFEMLDAKEMAIVGVHTILSSMDGNVKKLRDDIRLIGWSIGGIIAGCMLAIAIAIVSYVFL
jgi:hypothetical protein